MDSVGFLKTILRLVIISLVFNVINIVGQDSSSGSQGPVWYSSLRANCALFRNDTTAQQYGIWPEDFNSVYCCQDETPFLMNITQYLYSPQRGFIRAMTYTDLGVVDKFTPYWLHCWVLFQLDQEAAEPTPIQCEYYDIHKIYTGRFLERVMARDGLERSALPFVAALEIAVVLYIVARILWCVLRDPETRAFSLWYKVLKKWWDIYWLYLLVDWLDLLFLGLNGNALVEAVGHSDLQGYSAILFYNIAVFYTWLTLLTLVCYFLIQAGMWTYIEGRERNLSSTPETKVSIVHWLKEKEGPREWRWQRFGYQFFCFLFLDVYCLIPEDGADAANILIPVLLISIIWSALTVTRTGFRGARELFADLSLPLSRKYSSHTWR